MENNEILRKYLNAVKQAVENDNRNLGFYVAGPEAYLSAEEVEYVDRLMTAHRRFLVFYDSVGVYFDAKSHYATEIDGISIDLAREEILKQAADIEKAEGL